MSEKNVANRPIGIFDSGMGGVSVLGEALKWMPSESFIYYGDAANAPYGEKSTEEIISLSERVCAYLLTREVKAIVIACNTATSAAAASLRKRYPAVPILGMEPALKPAASQHPDESIVVMATEVTLREKKFADLMQKTAKRSQVIKLPCPSLVRLVERGILTGPEAETEILKCFETIEVEKIGAIVLGCTHFVFLRKALKKLFGDRIQLIDGNEGTVRNLQATLSRMKLLAPVENEPTLELINSLNEVYTVKMKQLLGLYSEVV
jgi:glutamate racemase